MNGVGGGLFGASVRTARESGAASREDALAEQARSS